MLAIDSLPVVGEEKITYALLFFDQGVHIAPCKAGTKEFISGFGPHRKFIDSDVSLSRYLQSRNLNYALLSGTGSGDYGLVVIDFDDPEIYQGWLLEAGDLAQTFTVCTHRGVHVYYWSKDLRSWRGDGFEVMGRNKAVMGPLCQHPAGGIYQPANRPYIRKVESLIDFPLLSKRPDLETPPIHRPSHLGGGIVQKIKGQRSILAEIENRSELKTRIRLRSSDQGKGRWYTGFCPFHEDRRKPSFWVDAERNIYGCRSCDAKGDVINFLSLLGGQSVQEVIKSLAAEL